MQFFPEGFKKIVNEEFNVTTPVFKGKYMNGNDIKPEKEVFPEFIILYLLKVYCTCPAT